MFFIGFYGFKATHIHVVFPCNRVPASAQHVAQR